MRLDAVGMTGWAYPMVVCGRSVLERTVARVRTSANARLHRLLIEALTPDQRARLDNLVEVPESLRQSPLDRLRDGPYIQSGREISRALARLAEIRAITNELPSTDRLPPGKVSSLARFAVAVKAQAVARLPADRRAFIQTLEASAGDDVIDLFDAVTTSMFAQAATASKEARLRSLRDLDAAALKLRDAAIVVLDPETPDAEVRTAIFQLLSSDALAAAAERVGTLAEPHDDTYFTELRKHPPKIAYTPRCLLVSISAQRQRVGHCLRLSNISESCIPAANAPVRCQPPSHRKHGIVS